jgi:D-alanyl-D-alanine carboxypeptidase (penicillin-binding protein 5/6)
MSLQNCRLAFFLLLGTLLIAVIPCEATETSSDSPKPPDIRATAAILIDAVSGQVLYAKNPDQPRPPASTTKIMTAILLLEHVRPEEIITASKQACRTEGSGLHLQPGEKVLARDMLYAILLRSANDGCVAVAEYIAGSEARFAEMMTAKAREIGATHTTFKNSHGLDCPGHLTTARDLAIIARYASLYPEFNAAVRTKYYTLARSSNSKDVLLRNHAKFLWKFPGADGVKTGYTYPAGRCFVGGATWNGWRLISVVLNSPDVVEETARLMKYGFQNFTPMVAVETGQVCAEVPVKAGKTQAVPAIAQNRIQYVIPKGAKVQLDLRPQIKPVEAPILAGMTVGVLEAYVDGHLVGNTKLLASQTVERTALVVGGMLVSGWYLLCAFGILCVWYATTSSKTARLRRNCFQAFLRGYYRRG